MPDLKISELPAAATLADGDIAPIVQASPSSTTRRASLTQLRRQILTDRGVDVRDFGAVGNGTANDAPAIQAAINALGAAGGCVHLGARSYRIASPITVNGGAVRLVGQGFNDGGLPVSGTWLLVDQTGFTPFTFTGVAARGSAVVDLAVRQTHNAAQNASWAPTNYGWFFRVIDCLGGVDFENVMLSGVNRGILVRNSGRVDIRRLRGQVFAAGVEMDECFDVLRIMNVHLWPYWSANVNVVRWQQNNGDAFTFRRVDGVFIDQSFVLGYRSMFRFSPSAAGVTQKFSIGQAYADFVRHGLLIDANGVDGQIDAMSVQCEVFEANGAPLPGSIGIHVNAHTTRLQIGGLRIDDAEDNAIRVEQHSNRLDIGALKVVNYNLRNNGAAAVHIVNAATGLPNRVNLGSDPLLLSPTPGPLINPAGNGSLGVLAPAGTALRPGLALGEARTGLFRPAAGQIAAAADGEEVLRAGQGSMSLGGGPGSHGLQITTPAAAANRMEVLAGPTGTPGRAGWRAQGADANIDAVIGEPKGSGAILGQFPDGAVAGGQARGSNATDLQTSRNAATQVASGNLAVLLGGERNTASGIRSAVLSGLNNTASQTNAVICGGANNTVSSANAAIGGGSNNACSGPGSWIPGGQAANTRGQPGTGAWAGGQFSSPGDAQASERVLRQITDGATPLRLTSDGNAAAANNSVNLPNNATYRLKLLVVAQQTGGSAGTVGDTASWEVSCVLRRGANAASTTYVGGAHIGPAPGWLAAAAGSPLVPGIRDAGAANWRLTLAADTTLGGLSITATGEADRTIRWVARVMGCEVTA